MKKEATFFASRQEQNQDINQWHMGFSSGAALVLGFGLICNNTTVQVGIIGQMPTAVLGLVLLGYSYLAWSFKDESVQSHANLK